MYQPVMPNKTGMKSLYFISQDLRNILLLDNPGNNYIVDWDLNQA